VFSSTAAFRIIAAGLTVNWHRLCDATGNIPVGVLGILLSQLGNPNHMSLEKPKDK
jgi:hypothetical protein